MKTFLDFTNKMRRELFPAGEALTLKNPHTTFFKAAMTDIQAAVPCVQKNNVTAFPFCGTYWEDAKTVVDQVQGVIFRVYTIANDNWRDPVNYYSANWAEIYAWSRRLFRATNPAGKKLQQGYYPANASTDAVYGRARTGIWTINRNRIYVAPYLQSNEVLYVEWAGIKSDWADTDGVDTDRWTVDYEEAIKAYVAAKHQLFYGDKNLYELFMAEFTDKRKDLMIRCREMTMQQEDSRNPDENRYLTSDDLKEDASTVPVGNAPVVTCFVADWAETGTPLDDVETQVEAVVPSLIIMGGDNWYEGNPLNIPSIMFSRFANLKKVFAFGNHDFLNDPTLSTEIALAPNNTGIKRYFTVVNGSTQFFVISSDPHEPDSGYVDANTPLPLTSTMVQWLSAMLSLSTAKWKIVISHHGPWMSDSNNTPGNKWLRLDYKAMGADLFINGHGHNFEHVQSGGLNYFTCGLGGASIRAFGANTPATIVKQWNSDYAFLKLTVDCSSLVIDLIDRTGVNQYSFALSK